MHHILSLQEKELSTTEFSLPDIQYLWGVAGDKGQGERCMIFKFLGSNTYQKYYSIRDMNIFGTV